MSFGEPDKKWGDSDTWKLHAGAISYIESVNLEKYFFLNLCFCCISLFVLVLVRFCRVVVSKKQEAAVADHIIYGCKKIWLQRKLLLEQTMNSRGGSKQMLYILRKVTHQKFNSLWIKLRSKGSDGVWTLRPPEGSNPHQSSQQLICLEGSHLVSWIVANQIKPKLEKLKYIWCISLENVGRHCQIKNTKKKKLGGLQSELYACVSDPAVRQKATSPITIYSFLPLSQVWHTVCTYFLWFSTGKLVRQIL